MDLNDEFRAVFRDDVGKSLRVILKDDQSLAEALIPINALTRTIIDTVSE